LVSAFRTSHALVRYTDGAALLHRMSSCWYDAMSQLVTFTRKSPADSPKIEEFQEILLRLFSLLSALSLDQLEHKHHKGEGHVFDVIGWDDLPDYIQEGAMTAKGKVEFVFQAVEQVIIDAQDDQVLIAAPPLLTRVFAELGQGLTTYHEAKKLSCVPLPYAYTLITRIILLVEMLFVPSMLGQYTAGYTSAFLFSFGSTLLLWFLNSVAKNLDNPFKKEASTLSCQDIQHELNGHLQQVILHAKAPKVVLKPTWKETKSIGGKSEHTTKTVSHIKQIAHSRSMLGSQLSSADLAIHISTVPVEHTHSSGEAPERDAEGQATPEPVAQVSETAHARGPDANKGNFSIFACCAASKGNEVMNSARSGTGDEQGDPGPGKPSGAAAPTSGNVDSSSFA